MNKILLLIVVVSVLYEGFNTTDRVNGFGLMVEKGIARKLLALKASLAQGWNRVAHNWSRGGGMRFSNRKRWGRPKAGR